VVEEAKYPVFVVGSSRSGTTLLFSFLLASGEFPLYEEGETHLAECRRKYGDPRRDANFRRFLNDWFRSLQFRRSGLDATEFATEAWQNRQSYEEVMGLFMNRMARLEEKPRWAEKTPANVFHMERLAAAFPEARFVHVVRDGRDVALSIRRLGWTGTQSGRPIKQLICAAKNWERAVVAARASGRHLGDRYLEVRYEELVATPEPVLARVREFTGAEIPESAADSAGVGALREGFSAFDEKMSGLSTRGLYRWKSALKPDERVALSATIGSTLRELGYEDEPLEGAGARSWLARAEAAGCSGWARTKNWLAEHTPLGAFSESRLEFED